MDDTVNRQAAIDAAIEAADEWDGGCIPSRQDMIKKAINKLPSAEQHGGWIKREYIYPKLRVDMVVCSECREEFSYDAETGILISDYDFCPNCGAKMDEA